MTRLEVLGELEAGTLGFERALKRLRRGGWRAPGLIWRLSLRVQEGQGGRVRLFIPWLPVLLIALLWAPVAALAARLRPGRSWTQPFRVVYWLLALSFTGGGMKVEVDEPGGDSVRVYL